MQRKSLDELLHETYSDPELLEVARQEVEKAGTEKQIVKGQSVLPHPIDLMRHIERNRKAQQPTEE